MRFKKLILISVSILITGCASQQSLFQKASSTNTIQAYEEFLKKYPDGEFSLEAKIKKEKLEYESAKSSNTLYQYETFLKNYPDSKFKKAVEEEITFLKLQETDDKNKYTEFMELYPESKHISFINEKFAYFHTLEIGTKDSFEKFLENYPNSKIAPRIKLKLQLFEDAYIVNENNWRLAAEEYKKMKYSSYYFYFEKTMLDKDAETYKIFSSGNEPDTLRSLVTTRPINHRNYEYLNVFSCMIKGADEYASSRYFDHSLKGNLFLTSLFTFNYGSFDEEGITATIYCRSDEYDSNDVNVLKYKNEVLDMLEDNMNCKARHEINRFLAGIEEKEKNKALLLRIDNILSN